MFKKLKNIAIPLGLCIGLSAHGANFAGASFLGTAKQVTVKTNANNVSLGYGDTNVFYVSGGLVGCYSFTTNYIQPTIDASGFYWFTNTVNAYSPTNAAAGGTNQSTIVAPFPFQDVSIFADLNGNDASAAIGVSLTGLDASCTNDVQFTFVPSVGQAYNVPGSYALYGPQVSQRRLFAGTNFFTKFQFTVAAQGVKDANYITNIPTTALQGEGHWRLDDVIVKTNVAVGIPGGTVFINSLQFRGFMP